MAHLNDDLTGPISTAGVPTADDVDQVRADVVEARAVEREVAEQTYQVAADRLPRRVQGIARTEAARVSRRIGLVGALLAALLSIAIALAAYSTASTAATTARTTQETVTSALERLGQANDALQARGQAPVPAPAQTDNPTDAIAAAVLAQVLASLPPSPTADEVAARIQATVVAQVLGPTMDELTRQVAEYLRANPPDPGPAPTEAQILAAARQVIAENPPRDGVDGRDPPCLFTAAMCQGRDGENGSDGLNGADGQDGRSILTGPEPVRMEGGGCVWRSTYSAEPLVQEYPAGDAACPGAGILGLGP